MPKVYCKSCRHYGEGDHSRWCNSVKIATSDWYEESYIPASPSIQNKNNDCKHWEHKRELFELALSLLN